MEADVRALVARARSERAHAAHAVALRALAAVHRARWEHTEAARLLDTALRLAARHGDAIVEAEVRGARAAVRHGQGRVVAAGRDVDAALAALSRASDVSAEDRERLRAFLQLQRAALDHNAGRLRDAEVQYRRILSMRHASTDVTVRVANNLAMILAARGRYEEAHASSARAVEVAAGLGPATHAVTRQTHAWISVHRGRLAEGLAEFAEVADAYRSAAMPLGEHHVEVAEAMADLRLLPEAIAAAEAAVEEHARSGTWLMWVEAQTRLAHLCLAHGDAARARDLATAVLLRSRTQRRHAWQARALVLDSRARAALGLDVSGDVAALRRAAAGLQRRGDLVAAVDAHMAAGRAALTGQHPARARGDLEAASRLAARGPLLLRVRGRVASATAALVAGDDVRAVGEARAGLRDLASHRSSLPTMELRALASGHGGELGEIGLRVLLRTSGPTQVLRWMERTRAAALAARLPLLPPAVAGADRASGEALPERALRDVVRGVGHAVEASAAVPSAAQLPDGWQDPPVGAPPTTSALRGALGGRVLVEIGVCDGRYVAVVVDPRRTRVVPLARTADVVAAARPLVFALRRLADPSSPQSGEAARLSADVSLRRLRALLLEPCAVEGEELVVVPVGALHQVPWAALHDRPVALAPSATSWWATATAGSALASSVVLVAGPGLRGAQEEVDALARLHRHADVLGPTASRSGDVLAAVRGAGLAHLACHGVPRIDNPMFSALVLADRAVTVQELHELGGAPQRLVLASCHAGADVAYDGDEVLGFVSAMLARGTRGVVASIAAVPDVEVVDLMLALHRRLAAGETMARALHGARGEIDRDTPAGFVNWCTFGAHGAA
ncbi:CHAT domain-containing protein [Cellulomonas wangsupingiae]|uniref:CHAT domain-containing protein n=1 Tax=Cellulomonas wangsupingiae TaxID=2968085 RepID=A0ABY5K194_9CELL|nr:CHAT domain-containing tetratricopeptide repeat protein [Cellulomonas wangsupingiae]MCC2335992.1 CHAT domain-containing protein [Cellulomonas wangsupingiae]UUI64216.1 CHAT domain-containing protein [Cellulomonas wangsupingiae]